MSAQTWRVTVTVSDPLKYAAPRTVTFRWLVDSAGGMRITFTGDGELHVDFH